MPGTDLAGLTRRILDLEEELDLFDVRVDGAPVWERLRFGVQRSVQEASGLFGPAHAPGGPRWRMRLRAVANAARALGSRNPFRAGPADVLVKGHPRRKPDPDGRWRDIYADELVEAVDRTCLVVEPPTGTGEHRTPAVTADLRHLDPALLWRDVRRHLGVDRVRLGASTRAHLQRAEARFEEAFGASVDLVGRAVRAMTDRRSELALFGRILDRVRPEALVVVVSYDPVSESLVEAARDRGVPSVELQHGIIGPEHLGYAYPGDRTKAAFPDHLFAFGPHWADAAELPVPADRVHVVGYPYLEREQARYADVERRDQVVFVSQGLYGRRLSRVAADLAAADPPYDVVYKLHPGERPRWPAGYPELAAADVRVVAGDDPPLYRLFAESRVQVGVNSTALFEGLSFGLATLLLDAPGVELLNPLLDAGAAETFGSADELATLLEGDGPPPPPTEPFFAPGAAERMRKALDAVVAGR